MKYQLELLSEPNELTIHVRQRLIQHWFISVYGSIANELQEEALNPEKLFSFCSAVSELDGIIMPIHVGRYHVRIEKSPLFEWEDLIPHIEIALQFLSHDGTVKEAAPPVSSSYEGSQILRKLNRQDHDPTERTHQE